MRGGQTTANMGPDTAVSLVLAMLTVTAAVMTDSKDREETEHRQKSSLAPASTGQTISVRVEGAVPRHQCRRALRNLEVGEKYFVFVLIGRKISFVFMQEFLNEVSKHIFSVSGGADLVTSYSVELPPAWRNTECTANLAVAEGQLPRAVDLRVANTQPLTGDRPWARQYGGCGARGSEVVLPHRVLTAAADLDTERLGLALLEVTRWRYGVFPEVGVAGDLMYPLNNTEAGLLTLSEGCTAEQRKLGGGLCPLEAEYNSFARTKQNLLCGGRSARRTIADRFSGRDGAKFSAPAVRYVMPLDTKRVVLVLDQSPAMAAAWPAVLAATFQFINSLREGTELAILSFSESATVHLPPTRVEGGNREGLHYRIPRRLQPGTDTEAAEMKSCLDCAIEMAATGLATNTTTIVSLLSSYVYFDSKNNGKLMEFEQSANTIFHWLVVGSAESGGAPPPPRPTVFLVAGAGQLATTSQLSLGLAAAASPALQPSTRFHHEQLGLEPASDTRGSFSVEASLSSDLWLQLLVEDTTAINVFEVKSPSGQIFSFPKFDAGLVYFSLRGPRETGVWSYRVKLYPSDQAGAGALLECWAAGGHNTVQLEAWTLAPAPELDSSQQQRAVVVLARLQQGGVPVSGAAVVARVGGREVALVDSGRGYPDITAGDGVYSGYFTQFRGEPGLYSVTVTATNNSSASVLNTKKLTNLTLEQGASAHPAQPSIPLEAFRRDTAAPSFAVTQGAQFYLRPGQLARRDVFPPVRVTDFRLEKTFNSSLFVSLAWTAPGDDLTFGTAFRYEVRCFTKQEALTQATFSEQGILIHDSLVPAPEPAGTEQRATVGVPWPNEVFYYAMVAQDAAGNRNEVSNTVAELVEEPLTTTTRQPAIRFSNMKDVSATLPLKSFIQSESLMYIIAGIISLILIIIVIILTVIIRRLGGCLSASKDSEPSSLSVSVAGEGGAGGSSAAGSLPDLCTEQQLRASVSYISGYDLPEMLEYSLDCPAKPQAQPTYSAAARRVAASETSQYLGMAASSTGASSKSGHLLCTTRVNCFVQHGLIA